MSALRSKTSAYPKTFLAGLMVSASLSFSLPVFADVTYGPVQATDTLSKIVNRFYVGSNRSTIGLMQSIVATNPNAFVRGNMNLLKRDALLTLPGDDWLVNEPRFRSPETVVQTAPRPAVVSRETNSTRSLEVPKRSPQQMQDRIVFLEAERESLISQVAELKRETVKLEQKIQRLELDSRQSDEQLRVLDKEIIRLTELLENKNGVAPLPVNTTQLSELQNQLRAVQQETQQLRSELSSAQTALSNNKYLKSQADQTIAQLTQENKQLQHLLKEAQPGVHYFGESSEGHSISLFGGKLNIPVWLMIMGGALASLVLFALFGTRRKKVDDEAPVDPHIAMTDENPFDDLLETPEGDDERGFAQASNRPEENVFKMFDEGSLEMDLKLDMAEAYLQVSDVDSAKAVLQEVLEGGSELQQRKANRLLKQAA